MLLTGISVRMLTPGSCTNTNDAPGGPNWLMVDLQRVYTIGYVVVVNRADGLNGEWAIHTCANMNRQFEDMVCT